MPHRSSLEKFDSQDAALTDAAPRHGSSKKLVRGSALMLAGRFCSVGINFLVQVLIVRALVKEEFGLFAYALSIMGLGSSLAVMGLGKALERFVPIYHEQGHYRKMAETTVVILVAVFGGGVLLAVGIAAWQIWNPLGAPYDAVAAGLVVIIGILIPFEAANHILEKMFAVYAKPKALFMRRYVVGPALKISAVVCVLVLHGGVRTLAGAYVVAAIVETIYSIIVLHGVLRRDGLVKYFAPGRLSISVREIFAFSAPMALSDLMPAIRAALVTIVLEFTHGVLAVAAFRAVLPVARLNQVALESFRLLFTPTIARLYARDDRAGIEHAYWLSSAWIAVVTFPLFAFCCVAPDYLSSGLFGAEYGSSAPLLAVMSLGFYVAASLGFARQVLPTFGKVGMIFWGDVITAVMSVVLTLVAVPRWGAIGGACASSAGLLLGAAINQWSLFHLKLVRGMDRKCLQLFVTIGAALAISLLARGVLTLGPVAIILMLIGASLAVAAASYSLLDIQATFPEIQKITRVFGKLAPSKPVVPEPTPSLVTSEVSSTNRD
jgi:O-antigen/teichoic acid export membrane protein